MVELFAGIDAESIRQLTACMRMRIGRYEAGERIAVLSGKLEKLGIVISGSAHLELSDIDGSVTRVEEYRAGNYCVCGGDFNHDFTGDSTQRLNGGETAEFGWAQPFPIDMLPKGLIRCTDYTCGEQRPTCRNCDIPYEEGNFTIIVDGFIVSDNVTVTYLENVQTGFTYSDHNPVVMRFTLNPV